MNETQLNLFHPDAIPLDKVLEDLGPEQRGDEKNWPSTLAELVDVVLDYFNGVEFLDSCQARTLAENVVIVIAHHLGSRSIYLPGDDRLRRAVRDTMIFREFNGSNHLDLAKKTGLTTTQIYNIIKRQRRIRHNRLQPSLPSFPK